MFKWEWFSIFKLTNEKLIPCYTALSGEKGFYPSKKMPTNFFSQKYLLSLILKISTGKERRCDSGLFSSFSTALHRPSSDTVSHGPLSPSHWPVFLVLSFSHHQPQAGQRQQELQLWLLLLVPHLGNYFCAPTVQTQQRHRRKNKRTHFKVHMADCSSLSTARGRQLCLSGAGVQRYWRGDVASRLRGLQRLHLCLRSDGRWQVLHHDGETGCQRSTRNHSLGTDLKITWPALRKD